MSVLIVDDDEDIRLACVEVLQMAGVATATAADGQEALDALRAGMSPQLILLDLSMPKMNGVQFREAQLDDPEIAEIPVVVISAAGQLADRVAALCVAGILPKPFAMDDLISTVQRWCH